MVPKRGDIDERIRIRAQKFAACKCVGKIQRGVKAPNEGRPSGESLGVAIREPMQQSASWHDIVQEVVSQQLCPLWRPYLAQEEVIGNADKQDCRCCTADH